MVERNWSQLSFLAKTNLRNWTSSSNSWPFIKKSGNIQRLDFRERTRLVSNDGWCGWRDRQKAAKQKKYENHEMDHLERKPKRGLICRKLRAQKPESFRVDRGEVRRGRRDWGNRVIMISDDLFTHHRDRKITSQSRYWYVNFLEKIT